MTATDILGRDHFVVVARLLVAVERIQLVDRHHAVDALVLEAVGVDEGEETQLGEDDLLAPPHARQVEEEAVHARLVAGRRVARRRQGRL